MLALIPVTIPPNSTFIRYIGRFDQRVEARPRCAWPACAVEVSVRGSGLFVSAIGTGQDLVQIEVDGQPQQVVQLKPGENSIAVTLGHSSLRRTVRIIKRTESFVGTITYTGFTVTDGTFLKPVPPKRRLEIIGDSISCGYGNEGASQNEHFAPATENAYQTYGSIAARAIGADVAILAWSGRKMWPDNTIPEIYDLTVPTDPTSASDKVGPAPDAVVINLATNDFGAGVPEEKGWTGAYSAFIKKLRARYPKAFIYPAIGSMMSDSYPPGAQSVTKLRGYLTRIIESLRDPRVKLIEFETQKMEDGIGSDWHPNLKTHRKMAAKLVEALKADLK